MTFNAHSAEALQQAALLALSCLDLTNLNDDCSEADIDALCHRAQGENGKLPATAAVCVWPRWVAHARAQLPASIAVAAVVNFPSGEEPIADIVAQVAQIRAGGGQEVDLVLPYKSLLKGDIEHCKAVLSSTREASQGLILKVILESGELPAESIALASQLALDAGADFLKTSTGKTANGASLEAAQIMLKAKAANGNPKLGFKPSGGLRTVQDVIPYLMMVQEIIGVEGLTPQRFRIGASGIWNDIAAVLGQTGEVAVGSSTY